jgi:hypothetical protein
MRIYISGKMRGIPNFNFPAFDAAKAKLEAMGHDVCSPADLDRATGYLETQLEYARRDIKELLGCEAIYMLRGWEKSVGAAAEFHVAKWAGLILLSETGSKMLQNDYCLANVTVMQ